jgi:hypothetical protein
MRHHGTNGKNDGNMEGIPVDLDEGTVKHVANMGDYVCQHGRTSGSAGIVGVDPHCRAQGPWMRRWEFQAPEPKGTTACGKTAPQKGIVFQEARLI